MQSPRQRTDPPDRGKEEADCTTDIFNYVTASRLSPERMTNIVMPTIRLSLQRIPDHIQLLLDMASSVSFVTVKVAKYLGARVIEEHHHVTVNTLNGQKSISTRLVEIALPLPSGEPLLLRCVEVTSIGL